MSVFYVPGLSFKKGNTANKRIGSLLSPHAVSSLPPIPLKDLYNDKFFDKNADILAKKAKDKDVVVAYSAGARVVREAIDKGAKFSKIILIGPAIESDIEWPKDSAKKIHIMYNNSDSLLGTAALLPNNKMGALGLVGYRGPKDNRIMQYDAKTINSQNTESAHMDYARKENAYGWGEMLNSLIDEED